MNSNWEGICPACGLHYHGWALTAQRNQLCLKCGTALEIRKDGVMIRSGFSPFKAAEYVMGAEKERWEDLRDKNLLFYLTKN
jgi:hypothetical protein